MENIEICYQFILPDTTITLPVQLNPKTLALVTPRPRNLPSWTGLEFHRCPNCPGSFQEEHCPVATSLSTMVPHFERLLSHDQIEILVSSAEREIRQQTTVQRAVASYMGLVMASCGCPNTVFLRPMARFHLPLASETETIYRAFSMYALAQYFVRQHQGWADDSFQQLEKKYRELLLVNGSLVTRLRAASQSDSSVNALLNLDVYARAMPYVIDDSLEELSHLFAAYTWPQAASENDHPQEAVPLTERQRWPGN
ncbi:DUF6901 family protein [Desulfogranum mediterraneum]|uniref:DUF6901 family protein n=1 Tax=Desulfogranum mediterraneum TaxID=160661 RepID=UPI0003FE3BA0|nr:hypothetical protein [Desulfogranum mediterraneum]